jgi:oxaloacetate decarboxylase beta subunit
MLETGLNTLWQSMGIANLAWDQGLMISIGALLIYLAISKKFEPLLLLPIGFGCILANIPIAGLGESAVGHLLLAADPQHLTALAQQLNVDAAQLSEAWKQASQTQVIAGEDLAASLGYSPGMLHRFYDVAILSGIAPLMIFMGVGALTDFSALIAMPRTLLLGAAAQFGIFLTLLGALALNVLPGFDFTLADASAIAIIGGADGPTAIFLASKLAPDLLGAIAVAAYSYMALVPIIQPPIMRLLTTQAERQIAMTQLRPVSKLEKILFPLTVLLLCLLFLPSAAPLIGMLTFGNLLREAGVVERLSKAAQNEIINIVTIILGLAVGSKLQADKFLSVETLGILALGAFAFAIGTATGILMAKLMNKLSADTVNPLIGAAGVSAVPMAARVVNKVGLDANPHNFLLMHAMGPNVAGVIGSAVAAGVLLALVGQ